MESSDLVRSLAARIAGHIQAEGLAVGAPLSERKLAERFRVSRSPVRGALKMLAQHRIVAAAPRQGFTVALPTATVAGILPALAPPGEDEALYLRLADEHLAGSLPERLSENALMRRFGIGRGQAVRLFGRAAMEGWAERLPGHGWSFLPVLRSAADYAQSYRFRILIEPAALLEPTWRQDRAALERCRARQAAVIEGGGAGLSPAQLFEIGNSFHEIVVGLGGNSFLVDGLRRTNRLRRLIEYRKIIDRPRWIARCREHLEILDLLLADRRAAAADHLRRHLETGARAKLVNLEPGP